MLQINGRIQLEPGIRKTLVSIGTLDERQIILRITLCGIDLAGVILMIGRLDILIGNTHHGTGNIFTHCQVQLIVKNCFLIGQVRIQAVVQHHGRVLGICNINRNGHGHPIGWVSPIPDRHIGNIGTGRIEVDLQIDIAASGVDQAVVLTFNTIGITGN